MPTYQFTIQRLSLQEAIIEIEAETLEEAIEEFNNDEVNLVDWTEFEDLTDQIGPLDTRVHSVRLEEEGIVKTFAVEDEFIRTAWEDLRSREINDEILETLGMA